MESFVVRASIARELGQIEQAIADSNEAIRIECAGLFQQG
jgi:hypothetical protein